MVLTDLAHTDVPTAAPETSIGDIAAALRERDADDEVVAVLDEGRPLGLLTAADIGRAFVAGGDLASRVAGDFVEADPVTIRESAERTALVSLLAAADARRAIVVDEGDEFVGVASLDDAIRSYGRELADVLELLE
ncbi:MAG: CBS domain-containing protein [Salinigranum sp.]